MFVRLFDLSLLLNMTKQYLTKERHDVLVQELQDLKNSGRRAVAEKLKRAKEFGDLSENSEYQEAREEQTYLERRIQELTEILRTSEIIKKDSNGGAVVSMGSKVTLQRDGKSFIYTIVGSNEAKPTEGFVSNESPMGKAVLGTKPGDKIQIQTPKGKSDYLIVSVE